MPGFIGVRGHLERRNLLSCGPVEHGNTSIGLIVIAVVIFLPRGLMGFVASRREIYRPGDDGNIGEAVRGEPDLKGRALGQQGGMLDA